MNPHYFGISVRQQEPVFLRWIRGIYVNAPGGDLGRCSLGTVGGLTPEKEEEEENPILITNHSLAN